MSIVYTNVIRDRIKEQTDFVSQCRKLSQSFDYLTFVEIGASGQPEVDQTLVEHSGETVFVQC